MYIYIPLQQENVVCKQNTNILYIYIYVICIYIHHCSNKKFLILKTKYSSLKILKLAATVEQLSCNYKYK